MMTLLSIMLFFATSLTTFYSFLFLLSDHHDVWCSELAYKYNKKG